MIPVAARMNAHGDGAASGSGSTALVVGKTTDLDLVDQAIVHLRRIWSEGLLKTVVAMGNYLIETFYGGSLVEAQSRSPRKPAALVRLYERADDLPVSVHALKQCVRIAAQYHELPRPLADGLSKAHHEALLSVADRKRKLELAQEAAEEHLSSRELVARINAEEQQRSRGGGRPPLPRAVRRMGAVLRLFDAPGFDDEIVPEVLQALTPADLERMRGQVRRVHEYLDRMAQALGTTHVEVRHVSAEAIDGLLATIEKELPALARMAPELQRLTMQVWACKARSIPEAHPEAEEIGLAADMVIARLAELERIFWPGDVCALKPTTKLGSHAGRSPRWSEAVKLAECKLAAAMKKEGIDADGWADTAAREPAPSNPDVLLAEMPGQLDLVLGSAPERRSGKPKALARDELETLLRIARRLRWVRGRVGDDLAWGTAVGRVRRAVDALGPTADTRAIREALEPATVPPMPWGQLLEDPVNVANPTAAELLAMMPREDVDDEGLATWLVGAVDVLNTRELAAALMPHLERVKALTGKAMKGCEDRRVRTRLRYLVQKMQALHTMGQCE